MQVTILSQKKGLECHNDKPILFVISVFNQALTASCRGSNALANRYAVCGS